MKVLGWLLAPLGLLLVILSVVSGGLASIFEAIAAYGIRVAVAVGFFSVVGWLLGKARGA